MLFAGKMEQQEVVLQEEVVIENTHEKQDAKYILKYEPLDPKLPVFLSLLYLAQCMLLHASLASYNVET